jgi:ATP-binding protein involved in chromosome partitioning
MAESAGAQGGPGQAKENPVPGVRHIIAISSGKGGVGKSTVSANVAVALHHAGFRVGLMDADVYGPNIPIMMGVSREPMQQDGKILPAESHGVKLISMGFFVPEETAVVWRGPMVHTAIQQFFRDVLWGELDYLLVDLPPGTGDAQLTLSQVVPMTGAVTVTTPQEVSLHDVRKGLMMFRKVNVPLLGLVENMSYFVCGHCGERTEIFAHGGGERAAQKLGIPFLGRIPIDPAIRAGGDAGVPIVVADPASPQTAAFKQIAAGLVTQVEAVTSARGGGSPLESLLGKITRPT